MKLHSLALFVCLSTAICGAAVSDEPCGDCYRRYSRFTDPGERIALLAGLPEEADEIASVASGLTVHHNLLAYHGIPRDDWAAMRRPWPPKLPDLLVALAATGPRNLSGERPVRERLVGACMMESHLLAGMLRYRKFPVRIRAGYFRNVQANGEHVLRFWESTLRARGIKEELLTQDPERWRREINAYTQTQIDIDKRIEHWVIEYWDASKSLWRILDANTEFLEASGGLDVDVHLSRQYFEFAFEAWQTMRQSEDFNPDQYAEWPQDGRSHIRSQLLWDFYSLLNHDIAGYDQDQWSDDDSKTEEGRVYAFVKERSYEELTTDELRELDELAALLAEEPTVEALVAFYRSSKALQIATASQDPHSFVFDDRSEPSQKDGGGARPSG